jgi:hypothetical protein
MRLAWVVIALSLISIGCAAISSPLPPALRIPQHVTGVSAVEQGSRIVVQFTLPAVTMENLAIRKPISVELRVGVAVVPFQLKAWEAGAKPYTDIPTDKAVVKYALPAAEWIGKDVLIGVEVFGSNGRTAGWAALVPLSLAPPLATPQDFEKPEDVAEGVRLTWRGSAPRYRIYRRGGEAKEAVLIGETDRLVYTDTTTEYGKTYYYSIEGFFTRGDVRQASDRTPERDVTPRDTWPPPVPTALAAVVSAGAVSLVWDRNVAPDLAGYRIYRAEGNGSFARLAEVREGPSYSDHTVSPGKAYRYAVSAFDQLNNESEKSVPVSVTAQ